MSEVVQCDSEDCMSVRLTQWEYEPTWLRLTQSTGVDLYRLDFCSMACLANYVSSRL